LRLSDVSGELLRRRSLFDRSFATAAAGHERRMEPQTIIILIAIVMVAAIAWRSLR
jgi:hypothetical protein